MRKANASAVEEGDVLGIVEGAIVTDDDDNDNDYDWANASGGACDAARCSHMPAQWVTAPCSHSLGSRR